MTKKLEITINQTWIPFSPYFPKLDELKKKKKIEWIESFPNPLKFFPFSFLKKFKKGELNLCPYSPNMWGVVLSIHIWTIPVIHSQFQRYLQGLFNGIFSGLLQTHGFMKLPPCLRRHVRDNITVVVVYWPKW